MRSFELVTGPKTDRWLVRTVALMMSALGVVLVRSARRGGPSADLACAAASQAAVIAGVDAYYSARGRISKVYLLDAVAEAVLVYAWARSGSPGHPSAAPDAINGRSATARQVFLMKRKSV